MTMGMPTIHRTKQKGSYLKMYSQNSREDKNSQTPFVGIESSSSKKSPSCESRRGSLKIFLYYLEIMKGKEEESAWNRMLIVFQYLVRTLRASLCICITKPYEHCK